MMTKRIRKEEIKQKLREIDDSVNIVQENLPSIFKNFLALGLVKDGIYKRIEFAIENVIDVCSILNADLSLGVPADDDDIIEKLEVNKVLSEELIKKIRNMKGFRNILVHRYGRVQDELAFDILHNNLSDFHIFKKEILKILKKKKR